jgi:hypothetical protein
MGQTLDLARDLIDKSKDMQYGWVDDQQNRHVGYLDADEERRNQFDANYKMPTPEQVEKARLGICWDKAEMIKKQLRDVAGVDVPVKTIYFELASGNTHTFPVFQDEDKWYWAESSWGKNKAVFGPFKSPKEIAIRAAKRMRSENKTRSPLRAATEYSDYPEFGMSPDQFMRWARAQKSVV